MEHSNYKRCTRCVMDTTDSDITFDENGVCNRCHEFDNRILNDWNYGKGHQEKLNELIAQIKQSGEGKEYDCILGLSGGLDSSYLLHLAVSEWGLRPFVFHIDAGWNLPVAESNIQKLCNGLGVKLHIEKMDFDEIRQMQLAFFKSGLPNLDVPQDHAFIALVDKYSEKLGVKYILNGYNICTEVFADPASWFEGCGPTGDDVYVKDVLRKNGGVKTKHYTYTNGFRHKFLLPYIKGVKTVTPLNYVQFTKKDMVSTLAERYGYVPYGQKHFEDSMTKFLEGWWAYHRYGHDIRIAWLSSLIVTGQMTRDEALEILKNPPLTDNEVEELTNEITAKLKISKEELLHYFNLPKQCRKYKSNRWAYQIGINLYTLLGLDKRIRR